MTPSTIQFLGLALAGLAAVGFDLSARRIPNWLCLVTAAAGLAFAVFTGGGQGLASHGAHMVIALVIGMILFALKIVGGGDAKFYAAVAAWFPLSAAVSLAVTISFAGLVLFLLWAGVRMLTGARVRAPQEGGMTKFPYALALAAGAMIVALPLNGWTAGIA